MSLSVPASNEVFQVRVQSYDNSNPSQKWNNNYTVINSASADYDDLVRVAQAIMSFQRQVTFVTVTTERAVISTRIADSNPYNGDEFTAVEYGLNGARSATTGNKLALEVCLFLRKTTITGRTGKLFIRGALQESDVEFGQSLFALTSPGGMDEIVQDAMVDSSLNLALPDGSYPMKLCIVSGSLVSYTVRAIQGISTAGVRMVNMNKRYYNRI